MGDPDLSPRERPRGLVIFPAAAGVFESRPRPVIEWIARWRVFIVTLAIGAFVVIAVALLLSARSTAPAAPALPPPAPSANPGSGLHP
jgi:anti-sigma-K factor RskA